MKPLTPTQEATLQRWKERHPEAEEPELTPALRLSVKLGLALCAWAFVGAVGFAVVDAAGWR